MKYDIAIIGGGPAGLMAAAHAGQAGAKVILIEKNPRLGVKLLLTGGGRCNLTNDIQDPRALITQLGKNGKFLFSGLHQFGVKETLDFFNNRGLKTKVENNGRVFPVSNRAGDVLEVLVKELKKYQVEVLTNSSVKKIVTKKNNIEKVILADGREIEAAKFIVATGGKSYAQTGSGGDGYTWLKQLGHTIIQPLPSLTPLLVESNLLKGLEGLSLNDAKLTLYQATKKICSTTGDIIFTATGLSGPAALDLSRLFVPAIIKSLQVEIDFLPQFDLDTLDKKLQQVLATSTKQIKNSLDGLVIPKFKDTLFKLSRINPEKKANVINRQERMSLVKLLKSFRLNLKSLAGFDRAMITKGGVALNEIDPKTMGSKIIDNLYLCGEVLDLDGPTGGFNLQICWTTGYVAGTSNVKR